MVPDQRTPCSCNLEKPSKWEFHQNFSKMSSGHKLDLLGFTPQGRIQDCLQGWVQTVVMPIGVWGSPPQKIFEIGMARGEISGQFGRYTFATKSSLAKLTNMAKETKGKI